MAMQGDVTVGAARFYRGDRTLVNGFVRVPHQLLTAVTTGPGGFAAFRLDVGVVDRSGATLATDTWSRQVPWSALRMRGSATVELLNFALGPGAYEVRVSVKDSASGRQVATSVAVASFAARPAASDLLVAYNIRRTESGDTLAGPGELRKGALLITTGPDLVLTPTQSKLYYYCEVYQDSAGNVPWTLRVLSADGRSVVTTPRAETPVAAGGGLVTGAVDLAGLPPGAYKLALSLGTAPDTTGRAAPFRMGGFEVEQQVAEEARTAAEAEDRFAVLSEAQLDTLFSPLFYLTSGSELSAYNGLTVDGKRRFLRAFWRQRDPDPGTPDNEAQIGFYRRIGEANRRFRETGGSAIPGWRTDRGRIFIVHGEPDEVLRRPSTGPTNPWEAWKYMQPRPVKYAFYDQTRLGTYVLIYTDDRKERSYPNWEQLLGPDAVLEVSRF